MNEWVVAVAIAVFGAIYAAGRIVAGTRKEVEHAKADINRMGAKIRDEQKDAARRHHNLCLVKIAAENDRKTRFKMAAMLRED